MSDIVERLRTMRTGLDNEAAEEIDRLRHWKAEATAVIEQWEAAWEAAGRPGELGRPKSDGLLAEINRLRDEIVIWRDMALDAVGRLRAEVDAERALADQLAEDLGSAQAQWGHDYLWTKFGLNDALNAWKQART